MLLLRAVPRSDQERREGGAGPNDEERGHAAIRGWAAAARFSSSVRFAFGKTTLHRMTSHEYSAQSDTFDLARFESAQEGTFDVALSEMRRGRKESHWMWFIFPQIDGLGSSSTSKKYAIRSLDEARAYLNHPVLGPRLLECCRAILLVQGKSASDIMGYPDDLKLRSSMTLFSLVADCHTEFAEVIEKYFREQQDRRTMQLLNVQL